MHRKYRNDNKIENITKIQHSLSSFYDMDQALEHHYHKLHLMQYRFPAHPSRHINIQLFCRLQKETNAIYLVAVTLMELNMTFLGTTTLKKTNIKQIIDRVK